MKNGTSLYLDLVRFGAALTVFLEHFREDTPKTLERFWSSHPFVYNHWGQYSQIAVIIFFVLSGYVIAHVLATRENTPLEYGASRFARLYSVVLPALILTAVCNYIVQLKVANAFNAFADFDALTGWMKGLYYLGTAAFVSHYWLWPNIEPPNADPFWSLSYEASFYLGIALFVFSKGIVRIAGIVLLCAAAGPTMVLLAPIWLFGYGIYHLSQRRELPPYVAIAVWLASTVLLFLCPVIYSHIDHPLAFLRMPGNGLGELLTAYAAALCFGTGLFAFGAMSDHVEPLFAFFKGPIRWLAATTFALYLFHQPLMTVFSVYNFNHYLRAAQVLWLLGGTFAVVATLGRLCERSKGSYKRFFLATWNRLAPAQ